MGRVWSKLRLSGSKRRMDHPTRFNFLPDDTLLRDIEDLSVVWLDKDINRSEDCIDTELELRRLIAYLKTFADLEDCVTYLTSLTSKHNRVFVIVSGALGIALLKQIKDLETIIWIYVFCENKALHAEWAKQYAKVRGVFVEKVPLFSNLLSDLAAYAVHLTPMRIFQSNDKQKSIGDLNPEAASFMWFQLLIRIIFKMSDNRDALAKKDLIRACVKRYEGDMYEQNRIKEFEKNYTTDQAINWYTKDSFLYRSVNRAFRTADIDIIYQFRFIIAEIHEQLANLPRPSTPNLIVHRGQIISTAEMQIIEANQNKGFISMNTFLSTSEFSAHATAFSAVGMDLPDGLESVVFEITVDRTRQPFANIDALSALPTEKEILFSVGTVFQINRVDKYDSGTIVYLTMTTEVEERFDALINHFLEEIGEKPTLATLGSFLIMQGDFNRAQRYFQFLVDANGPNLDDVQRAICYVYLGNIFDEKGEYERAMDYYEQALSIQQRTLEPDHFLFIATYNNITTIQMRLGQYEEAIKNFESCLSIELSCQPESHPNVYKTYNNLAIAYAEIGDYPRAAGYCQKAIDIEVELGLDVMKHPSMATLYHNLGTFYDDMKQYTKAVDHYERALSIQKVSLPPDHPSRVITEGALAMTHSQLGNLIAALEKCLVVLDIKLKVRPPHFPSLAKTYTNLGTIYQRSGDFNNAEENFKRSLQIYRRHLPETHPDAGTTHRLLGDLYDAMGKISEAMSSYQQAFDIFHRQEPANLAAVGTIYACLSSVEDNPQKAIEYAEQGLATLLSIDVSDKDALAFAYNALGMGNQKAEQLKEAIKNYTKALELGLDLVNGDENDPSLSCYYSNLGSAFSEQGDVDKALKYMHKALDNKLKIMDPLHSEMGELYSVLGNTYGVLDKHDQAIEFFQKAIDVYKQPRAQNLRLLASTYENTGLVHASLNDCQKAVEYYKLALDLQLKNLSPDDPDIVSTYSSLASVYENREDYATAITYLVPMMNIQQKILSSSELELAEVYYRVATCHHLSKQNQSAVEYYEKALQIQRRQKVPLASTYHSIGDAYRDLGELTTASNYYEISIKSLGEEKTEETIDFYEDLCILYMSLGGIQQRLNLFDKAINNLKRSLDLYNSFLADDNKSDELHCGILEAMAKVYDKTGYTVLAEECRKKKEKATIENTSV